MSATVLAVLQQHELVSDQVGMVRVVADEDEPGPRSFARKAYFCTTVDWGQLISRSLLGCGEVPVRDGRSAETDLAVRRDCHGRRHGCA